MPIKIVDPVAQPFVRGIHVPDVRNLAQMLEQRGQLIGAGALQRGQGAAATWAGLAQAFGQYQQAVQQRQLQAAALAQREQERAAAEQLKRDEMAMRAAERAQEMARFARTDERLARTEQRQVEEAEIAGADRLANNTLPGVVPSAMADRLNPSGRVQILDGAPVLMRTPTQARQAEIDAAAKADRDADNARMEAAQKEAARHNAAMEAQASASLNAKPVPAPPKMAAGTADKVAMAQTSLAALDKIEGLFKDDYVGPVAGRYNAKERSAPSVPGMNLLPDAPEGFEDFAAETATLKNQVIQAITGAAVGVQEQGRIMAQIPDITDTPTNWRAKAKATRRNLQELIANQIRTGTGAQGPLLEGTTVEVPAPAARQNPFRRP